MYKTEEAYFNVAKTMMNMSDHGQKLGCVIVDKHHIIGSGHNSKTKYHRIQAQIDCKYFDSDCCYGPVHAESSALIPLMRRKYDLRNATVYIYREHKDGSLGMARPCERCMSMIKKCGIKTIKYTTDDGYAVERLEY